MKMKPTEWLAEELDINGVLRYESGATLTQNQGPKRARGELFNDLEAAVAHRDRIQAAIDHAPGQCLVFVVVELKNLRRADCCGDFLNSHGRQTGDAKQGVECLCCSANRPLSLMMKQPLQCRGRQKQGQINGDTHHRGREIDLLNPCQHIGHEITAFISFSIAPVGDFIISRTVDVMENRARQTRLCQPAKLLGVVTVSQIHTVPPS